MKTDSHKFDPHSILVILEKQIISLRMSQSSDLNFLINFLKLMKEHRLLSSNGDQVAKILKKIKAEIDKNSRGNLWKMSNLKL